MGSSWVALSIKNIKTRASREMTSRKISKRSILMGWTLPSTDMWRGEVFAISDCLVWTCYLLSLVILVSLPSLLLLPVFADVAYSETNPSPPPIYVASPTRDNLPNYSRSPPSLLPTLSVPANPNCHVSTALSSTNRHVLTFYHLLWHQHL